MRGERNLLSLQINRSKWGKRFFLVLLLQVYFNLEPRKAVEFYIINNCRAEKQDIRELWRACLFHTPSSCCSSSCPGPAPPSSPPRPLFLLQPVTLSSVTRLSDRNISSKTGYFKGRNNSSKASVLAFKLLYQGLSFPPVTRKTIVIKSVHHVSGNKGLCGLSIYVAWAHTEHYACECQFKAHRTLRLSKWHHLFLLSSLFSFLLPLSPWMWPLAPHCTKQGLLDKYRQGLMDVTAT